LCKCRSGAFGRGKRCAWKEAPDRLTDFVEAEARPGGSSAAEPSVQLEGDEPSIGCAL
jgi:hypothetical protein